MLGIQHPIVQAGMSWASSCAELPIAVSNAGGLGVIAAGPLRVEAFREILLKVKAATPKPYAVNIPLYRPQADQILEIMAAERVPVVIASQGGPKAHLERFHRYGCKWIHVVASVEHARKAATTGVDALVVVGSEAGGHPPANEVSALVAIRRILQEIDTPVIASGGVADGYGIAAMLALGAEAVQLGTRFLLTHEASVHPAYKEAVLHAEIDGTDLVGRRALPIRMIKNRFSQAMADAERNQLPSPDYEALFRSSSLKLAALEGDTGWGKVEAGQSAGLVREILSAEQLMKQLVDELHAAGRRVADALIA